jgi:hypothetical protein
MAGRHDVLMSYAGIPYRAERIFLVAFPPEKGNRMSFNREF